jgi:hypothetical protein
MENLPWAPVDAMVNVILSAMFYAPAFAVVCVLGTVIPPRTLRGYLVRVGKLAIFVALLLVVGALFTILWGTTIYGWLYRSTDYCGNDFFPFVPIGPAALDAPFGNEPHGLLGAANLTQLRLAWLCFSATTWASTILIYGFISRWLTSRESSISSPTRSLLRLIL